MMIATGDWVNAQEPIARKNFFEGFREVPAEREMIYSVRNSTKLTETYLELGDIGSMSDFNGSLEYDGVEQGRTMTITAVEKAKGMMIQRKLMTTDQLNVVSDLPRMLGLSARRRVASDVFYPFRNAFNGVMTTIDGLSICNSAHTSSHEEGSNQSNTGTSAFSAVSLESTRISMTKFLTNRDNKFDVNPSLILCGTDLESAVWEVLNSQGKVDTANNNRNFHQGRFAMLSTKWLDDTNDWFLIDRELMKQWMVWNEVDKIDFKKAEDFDGFCAKYATYAFYGFGVRDWKWVYGHQVS